MAPPTTEAWLSGPVADVPAELMPVAHALVQARADLRHHTAAATAHELWTKPGAAARAGFHMRHLAGSLDRLFTYARGEPLSDAQRVALAREREVGGSAEELLGIAVEAIDRAIDQLRETDPATLLEPRTIGRAQLPTNVQGLLFHGGEHTARHVGQLITTLKVMRG